MCLSSISFWLLFSCATTRLDFSYVWVHHIFLWMIWMTSIDSVWIIFCASPPETIKLFIFQLLVFGPSHFVFSNLSRVCMSNLFSLSDWYIMKLFEWVAMYMGYAIEERFDSGKSRPENLEWYLSWCQTIGSQLDYFIEN